MLKIFDKPAEFGEWIKSDYNKGLLGNHLNEVEELRTFMYKHNGRISLSFELDEKTMKPKLVSYSFYNFLPENE